MSDTTAQVIESTALQTAETLAPIALAAAAASNPSVAAAASLAPIALQLLQAATQMQQAGAMSQEQLASLFASIGKSIQSTHAQWIAENALK